jgi:hypothetical protein
MNQGTGMTEPIVWVFFYGSFINLDVLKQSGYVPEQFEVACLRGFDIRIAPLANVVRSDEHAVYGIVATATHGDLQRLYSQSWVGSYLPEAVVVETGDGKSRPALCYIAPEMDGKPPANDYVDRILGPARRHGFPAWYIDRLERFKKP